MENYKSHLQKNFNSVETNEIKNQIIKKILWKHLQLKAFEYLRYQNLKLFTESISIFSNQI